MTPSIFKNSVDGIPEKYLYLKGFRLLQQLLADAETPHTGVVLSGTEELVDLFKKLTAGLAVFINYQHLGAVLGCGNAGGEAGRTRSDNQNISFFHCRSSFSPRPYCVSTLMPVSTGVTQVLVLGTPLTTILQSLQRPIPQKILRPVWFFAV